MKRKEPEIGRVYCLEDYTAPKVFTGECFECLYTEQRIDKTAKVINRQGLLKSWPHEIYKPERFKNL